MRTERPAASTVTASSLRPPERHGHAQRQRLNVVPPSLWYEQSHALAQHTLQPSSLCKLWECVKIRRSRIHPAAVCRQPTLVRIHVLVVRWAVQPHILRAHDLAQQVVVGVCVQGGDCARGSQPGVDCCHFASAKHTVLWRLHKHHTDINPPRICSRQLIAATPGPQSANRGPSAYTQAHAMRKAEQQHCLIGIGTNKCPT